VVNLNQKTSTTGFLIIGGLFIVGVVLDSTTDLFTTRWNTPLPERLANYWWDSEESCDEAFRLDFDSETAAMTVEYVDGERERYSNTVIETEDFYTYRYSGQDADGMNVHAHFEMWDEGLATRIYSSVWVDGEDEEENSVQIFNCGGVG
jgi:hypothetical protein